VDRDSEIIAYDFDERDPGGKEMIRRVVTGAKRNGRHSGICSQAPLYPWRLKFRLDCGSIFSLTLLALLAIIPILLVVSPCQNKNIPRT